MLAIVANLVNWWRGGAPDAPVMIALMVLIINVLLFAHVQRQVASLAKLVRLLEEGRPSQDEGKRAD